MSDRTAHLIVGVPRSGTSAVAQLLSDGGIWFGDPAHFLDTTVHKHNPNFFEIEWVNQVNNLAVEALGSVYSDDFLPVESDFDDPALDPLKRRIEAELRAEFGDAPHIGIKDPRFCFTFPLWQTLLEGMGYAVSAVITLRSEAACRRSNLALEAKWADDQTWTRFYLQSLLGGRYFTRGVTTVVVDYDRLMADPAGYVAALSLPGVNLAAATAKLDPALVHQRPAADDGDTLVARVQRALRDGTLPATAYLDYRSVAALQTTDLAPAMVRSCRVELAAAHELIAELTKQRDAHQLHAKQLTEVVAVKQTAVEDHERRATELDRQRAALQQHAGQLTEAVAVKQAAVEQHERHAIELERQRAALQLHADQLTEAVAAKQTAAEQHERHAAELERQRAALQLHADQLTEAVAAKQAAVEHHERAAAELDRQVAGFQEHADQLTAVVVAKQAALDHHVGELAGARRELVEARRELAEARQQLSSMAAEAADLRGQRAMLWTAVRAVARVPRWPWSSRRPEPLTEAQLEPVAPDRYVVGTAPMSGRVRVELAVSSEGPTRVGLRWDTGRATDKGRPVDMGPVDGPTTFTTELELTEPAVGFWLEPVDGGAPFSISRLRIFCVGR
jgi:hypothetical protein